MVNKIEKPKAVKKEVGDNVYFESVGRRKTSVARVRIFGKGKNEIIVNEKDFKEYFPTKELQRIIEDALIKTELVKNFRITIKVSGGGIHSQSEAVRQGISNALLKFDLELRKKLKQAGFLKRDPRMKERRKFGLKKARKSKQWSKR